MGRYAPVLHTEDSRASAPFGDIQTSEHPFHVKIASLHETTRCEISEDDNMSLNTYFSEIS